MTGKQKMVEILGVGKKRKFKIFLVFSVKEEIKFFMYVTYTNVLIGSTLPTIHNYGKDNQCEISLQILWRTIYT